MRKTVAAAAMAASLTLGGAAGAALFVPTISGAQTADTTEDADAGTDDAGNPRLEARLSETLAPLVTDGTITQAQADAVIAAIEAEVPDGRSGHRGGGFGRDVVSSVSEVLGLDAAEIRTQLAAGSTLREIADAQGVDPQAVVDAIVAEATERADAAVADGRITQEEADEQLADAATRAEESLDRTFEGRPFGRGGHGHAGADAPADDAPADDVTGS